MTDELKSVKLPQFDGKGESFQVWFTRFRCYAAIQKFTAAIGSAAETDLPNQESERTGDTAEQIAARKRNSNAIYAFTLAFTSDGLMQMVFASQTLLFSNGLAYLVVKSLMKRFQPDDTISRVEMRMELHKVSMAAQDDPMTLFEHLSSLQNRYKKIQIPKEDLIAVILSVAPKEYTPVLTAEQRAKGALIELADLQEAMTQHFRAVTCHAGQSGHKEKKNSGREVAFAAASGVKCYNCQEFGHVARNCPKKNNKGGKNGKKPTNNLHCTRCGKDGHDDSKCWDNPNNKNVPQWYKDKKNRGEISAATSSNTSGFEVLFAATAQAFPNSMDLLRDPNIWIADTGASMDTTGHKIGMYDMKTVTDASGALCADGGIAKAASIGKLPVAVHDNKGQHVKDLTLEEVAHSPKCPFNLISVTKRLMNGWKVSGDDTSIVLHKGDMKVVFDIKINTDKGVVCAADMQRVTINETGAVNAERPIKEVKQSIKQAHGKVGHPSEELTRMIAKALEWTITRGSLGPCEACAVSKAKQKNVPKESNMPKATKADNRLYLDCCTLIPKDGGRKSGKNVWRMMVFQCGGLKMSDMFKSKNGMVDPTLNKLYQFQQQNVLPKYLRMDNGGENLLLESKMISDDWKIHMIIEYTARDTPQQNAPVEVGFVVIANRAKALMYAANIPKDIKHLVFPEAVKTATLLDGLVPIRVDGKLVTRYEYIFGKLPPFVKFLRTWGEAGVVKVKS